MCYVSIHMMTTVLHWQIYSTHSPVAKRLPFVGKSVHISFKCRHEHILLLLYVMCFSINYTFHRWHVWNDTSEFTDIKFVYVYSYVLQHGRIWNRVNLQPRSVIIVQTHICMYPSLVAQENIVFIVQMEFSIYQNRIFRQHMQAYAFVSKYSLHTDQCSCLLLCIIIFHKHVCIVVEYTSIQRYTESFLLLRLVGFHSTSYYYSCRIL